MTPLRLEKKGACTFECIWQCLLAKIKKNGVKSLLNLHQKFLFEIYLLQVAGGEDCKAKFRSSRVSSLIVQRKGWTSVSSRSVRCFIGSQGMISIFLHRRTNDKSISQQRRHPSSKTVG